MLPTCGNKHDSNSNLTSIRSLGKSYASGIPTLQLDRLWGNMVSVVCTVVSTLHLLRLMPIRSHEVRVYTTAVPPTKDRQDTAAGSDTLGLQRRNAKRARSKAQPCLYRTPHRGLRFGNRDPQLKYVDLIRSLGHAGYIEWQESQSSTTLDNYISLVKHYIYCSKWSALLTTCSCKVQQYSLQQQKQSSVNLGQCCVSVVIEGSSLGLEYNRTVSNSRSSVEHQCRASVQSISVEHQCWQSIIGNTQLKIDNLLQSPYYLYSTTWCQG